MKKVLCFLIAVVLLIAAVGYFVTDPEDRKPWLKEIVQQEPEQQEPEQINLLGTWKQSNNSSSDSYQAAVITADHINIYWMSDNGDSQSLYWSGSIDQPEEGAVAPYKWVSKNNHEKTDMALLASPDDTKEFTYKDGQILYSASALGTTKTVRLIRTDDVIADPAAK